MTVCVLAGGVGAARMLAGVIRVMDPSEVTAIVNVGDDDELHGLSISPDLDTITYTLSGAIDTGRGWGLSDESWQAMTTLGRYATSAGRRDIGWFNLGDRDLGTHLWRTTRRLEGASLSEITAEITAAWDLELTLLPATDDPVGTVLIMPDGGALSFQEYFVRDQHSVEVAKVLVGGADTARPAPGVIDAILNADAVVIAVESDRVHRSGARHSRDPRGGERTPGTLRGGVTHRGRQGTERSGGSAAAGTWA